MNLDIHYWFGSKQSGMILRAQGSRWVAGQANHALHLIMVNALQSDKGHVFYVASTQARDTGISSSMSAKTS